jgi:amino acid transporter
VIVTAFASVFSLLLGYSRIPYAAACDGAFFRPFARLHPRKSFPHISLLTLGTAAVLFCFFSLADVIAALVVLRILLQFTMQHIGVMHLRRAQPELPRPFRLWLYPIPPILALIGFSYILFVRANSMRELLLTAVVTTIGAAFFFLKASALAGSKDAAENS